jgi:hypothetical protein
MSVNFPFFSVSLILVCVTMGWGAVEVREVSADWREICEYTPPGSTQKECVFREENTKVDEGC